MRTLKERVEPWDPETTYVVGHQRPDTDAIASALGYAWFLTESGTPKVMATRTGHPGAQALWALEQFDVEPPRLLTAVAPTFGHAARPQRALTVDATVAEALAELGAGARVVPVVVADCRPLGVVTPMALARSYGTLHRSCEDVVEGVPCFSARERLSDHRGALLRSDVDDFLVTGDDGRYMGLATRRRVLEPPRARLILVDHNELPQAVSGADEAEIVAVLDHHRLGNAATAVPIPFIVEPVGSTCTLVAERCRVRSLEPPAGLAGMMLSGILSDTLVFRSPTATDRDRAVAEWLAGLARVDLQRYGQELLHAGPGLAGRDPGEVLDADRKSYDMGGKQVSVAQVEVTGLQELAESREPLLEALRTRLAMESLALICLMVTDIVTGRSRLLCEGEPRLLGALPFRRMGDGEWDLGELVSRKKQLVPALHGVLEDAA